MLGSNEPSVLVIDDDRMSQMVLTRNLRQAGYAVQTASDGPEGLDKMRAGSFDLVILDFLMPEMDGYEVLSTIRDDPKLATVPVVVVSGIDDATNAATLVEAGAADYLTKPIDSGLLRARASRCIESKRMREREQKLYAEIEASYSKLRESERLRESLTHMIVHDLRTPLTSMLTSVKTVTQMGESLAEDRKQRLLELALVGGNALVGMINDLLDVHQLEGGSEILAKTRGDLGTVAARARDQLAALAERSEVELGVDVAPHPAIAFDAAKLERVIVNLAGNAVKATPPGGKVAIAIAPVGDRVVIRVTDSGVGIAPEHLPRIFEKFYRVDIAGKTELVEGRNKIASSGLGLTFCKLIVEAHGGTIEAASVVGSGTTITVSLPA